MVNHKNHFNAEEVFGVDYGMRKDLPPNIRLADLVIEPISFERDMLAIMQSFIAWARRREL